MENTENENKYFSFDLQNQEFYFNCHQKVSTLYIVIGNNQWFIFYFIEK